MKRIIHTNSDGGVSVIVPSVEALQSMTIDQIALKDVPKGLMYQIVEEEEIPKDRMFRNAWVLDNGVKEDNAKATDIAKEKVRAWRELEFKKNDIALQNAIVDDDQEVRADAVARREYLRDKPSECDNKSNDELKVIIKNLEM